MIKRLFILTAALWIGTIIPSQATDFIRVDPPRGSRERHNDLSPAVELIQKLYQKVSEKNPNAQAALNTLVEFTVTGEIHQTQGFLPLFGLTLNQFIPLKLGDTLEANTTEYALVQSIFNKLSQDGFVYKDDIKKFNSGSLNYHVILGWVNERRKEESDEEDSLKYRDSNENSSIGSGHNNALNTNSFLDDRDVRNKSGEGIVHQKAGNLGNEESDDDGEGKEEEKNQTNQNISPAKTEDLLREIENAQKKRDGSEISFNQSTISKAFHHDPNQFFQKTEQAEDYSKPTHQFIQYFKSKMFDRKIAYIPSSDPNCDEGFSKLWRNQGKLELSISKQEEIAMQSQLELMKDTLDGKQYKTAITAFYDQSKGWAVLFVQRITPKIQEVQERPENFRVVLLTPTYKGNLTKNTEELNILGMLMNNLNMLDTGPFRGFKNAHIVGVFDENTFGGLANDAFRMNYKTLYNFILGASEFDFLKDEKLVQQRWGIASQKHGFIQ